MAKKRKDSLNEDIGHAKHKPMSAREVSGRSGYKTIHDLLEEEHNESKDTNVQSSANHQRTTVESNSLLETKELIKIYDERKVVDGIDMQVKEKEIVGLLGPNGAGKTTSFYMIVGLVRPNDGIVLFESNDVTKTPMHLRARLGMGYLPQEESIFRKLTVHDNIMAVLETMNYTKSEREDKCHSLMKRFGIDKLASNKAITLSGGEKRRLTIARS